MPGWPAQAAAAAQFAARQLFFVGGAPRSGTTWLQQILDAHPDISCRGEGLFPNRLAEPLDGLIAQWRGAIAEKNTKLFGHTGGYPLPEPEDADFLLGAAIIQAMRRQCAGKPALAVGEKTPENVFFFPRLKQMFPSAKFIAIARDPRDVLSSAWHFFHAQAETTEDAKTAFIRTALPSLADGTRALIGFAERHKQDCLVLTYEALRSAPEPIVARLFRLLGVSDDPAIVEDCLRRTEFAAQTGGRPAGTAQDGSFLRKGVVGDWRSTLTPEMNAVILEALGWMFPHFGWQV